MTFHIKSQLKNKEQFPSKTGKKWLKSKGSIKKKKRKNKKKKKKKKASKPFHSNIHNQMIQYTFEKDNKFLKKINKT